MRPKGVIAFLIIVALLVGLAYLLSGKFLELGLESAGEAAVGAKVEIDNLKLNIAALSISLDRLQVTNPNDTWKNLFEAGRMSFDMEVEPLTRKKVIINDVTIANVRIGTKRDSDGALPKKPSDEPPGWFEKAAESLKKQVAAAPILNLGILKRKVNIDSLFAIVKFQTPAQIDSARKSAAVTFEKWRTELASFNPKEDLEKVDKQINELKSQEVKNLEQMVSALDKAKSVYGTLNQLKKETEAKKSSLTSDLKEVTSSITRVDNWIEDDFNAIKSKANIGDFSPQNVGKMLFGETIVLPTLGLMKYIDLARKYMPVAQQFLAADKVEKPPRFAGQDIHFPVAFTKPDFLMEKIHLSAATNQQDSSRVLRLSGLMTGLTSQPRIYGKPLDIELKAQFPQSKAYSVTGKFDHTKEVAKDRIEIKASGVRLGNINLPNRPYLPAQITSNRGDLSADINFIGDEFALNFSLNAAPVDFSFREQNSHSDVIAKVTRSVFGSIERLQISAGISGHISNPKLSIKSNIDDILSQRIQALVGESVRQARNEIRNRLNTLMEPKVQDLRAFLDENRTQLTDRVDQVQNAVDEKLAVVEQKRKELEEQIEKEKKKGLDKLKNIFKKND